MNDITTMEAPWRRLHGAALPRLREVEQRIDWRDVLRSAAAVKCGASRMTLDRTRQAWSDRIQRFICKWIVAKISLYPSVWMQLTYL